MEVIGSDREGMPDRSCTVPAIWMIFAQFNVRIVQVIANKTRANIKRESATYGVTPFPKGVPAFDLPVFYNMGRRPPAPGERKGHGDLQP